jgi:parallel beta-helix repeat protein
VDDCGIVAIGDAVDIRKNRVHANSIGICLVLGAAGRIRNNITENNLGDGILVIVADSTQVVANVTRGNAGLGIDALFCDFAVGAPSTTLEDNHVIDNGAGGIYAEDCPAVIHHNTVRGGSAPAVGAHGIHVVDTFNATVTRNLIQNSDTGLLLEQVSACTVAFNSANFNALGIDLVESDACSLTRNYAVRNEVGACRWDELGTHTFANNSCTSEIPPGAWD